MCVLVCLCLNKYNQYQNTIHILQDNYFLLQRLIHIVLYNSAVPIPKRRTRQSADAATYVFFFGPLFCFFFFLYLVSFSALLPLSFYFFFLLLPILCRSYLSMMSMRREQRLPLNLPRKVSNLLPPYLLDTRLIFFSPNS